MSNVMVCSTIAEMQSCLNETSFDVFLADIHLVEALLTEVVPGDKKDSLAQFYYQQIYFMHEVSQADVEQSMESYYQDPFILDSLYTKVVSKLEKDKELYVPKTE